MNDSACLSQPMFVLILRVSHYSLLKKKEAFFSNSRTELPLAPLTLEMGHIKKDVHRFLPIHRSFDRSVSRHSALSLPVPHQPAQSNFVGSLVDRYLAT